MDMMLQVQFFFNEKGIYDFVSGKGELLAGINRHKISVWSGEIEKYSNEGNLHNIMTVNTREKMMGIYSYEFKIQHLKCLKQNMTTDLSIAINNNLFDTNIRNIMTNISNTSYISSNIGYEIT